MALTPLAGRHVRLEELRPSDADALWPHAQDPSVWAYMPMPMRGRADFDAWVRDRRAGLADGTAEPYALRDGRTGLAVGSTSLFDIDRRRLSAEIGHTWIGAGHRRTGINTEAKLLLLGRAFGELGLRRVQLKSDARNEASRRAMERIGASLEGILRWHMPLPDGTMRNVSLYSIIQPEWPSVKARLEGLLARHAAASP